MIGASFSQNGMACAKPKRSAAKISRFGFQFDRIKAASASKRTIETRNSRLRGRLR